MNTYYDLTSHEIMVIERMKDIQCEAEKIRLLHKAGLIGPDLYERMAVAFGNALVNWGQRLQRKHTQSHQSYQATGSKYAA